ncbi:hypothetical protein [Streptomyces sp. NPDC002588]|uniref:hypothetical protein n=1 Tax=Streptomyces sp. NPDC002588 TaxID=3154419 RepID=UPI0033179489
MTVAGLVPPSVPVPARAPGGTGAGRPAALLMIRHVERTGASPSADGTAVPGHHDSPPASLAHRYLNP